MSETKERLYSIPLRKGWVKTTRIKRAKRAITLIKLFLIKHMKAKDVKFSQKLNEEVWRRGVKKPLGKIKILAEKNKEDIVFARIPEEKEEVKKDLKLIEKKEEGKEEAESTEKKN